MSRGRKIIKYNNYTTIKKDQALTALLFGVLFLLLALLNSFKICGFLSFILFIVYLIIYSLHPYLR